MTMQTEHSPFPSDETLAAYIDGRVDEETRKRVVEHMAECPECFEVVMGARGAAQASATTAQVMHEHRPVVISLAAVAAVALLLFVGPIRERLTRARDSRAILAAAPPRFRPVEGRLAGFPYRPLPPVRRGSSEDESDLDPETANARSIAYAIRSKAATTNDAEALHARGVAELVIGDRASAMQSLELAIKREQREEIVSNAILRSTNVQLLSDLAVAALTLAKAGHPEKIPEAMEAADRAWRQRQNSETAWNRALAVEALGIPQQAIAAWNEYLSIDASSLWSKEAREHIERLSQPPISERWKDIQQQFAAAVNSVDEEKSRRYAIEFPTQVSEMTADVLLANWGRLYVVGDSHQSATIEQNLRMVGRALASADPFIEDTMVSIGDAGPEARQRLARAHVSYAAARQAYANGEIQKAGTMFANAAAEFRRGNSPFHAIASVYEASCWLYSNEFQKSLDISAGALETLNDRYARVVGLLLWIKGMSLLASGDVQGAMQAYRRALNNLERVGDLESEAAVEALLAAALEYGGRSTEAWQHRIRALQRLGELGSSRRWQAVINELTEGAIRQNYPSTAVTALAALIDTASRTKDFAILAEGLLWRAVAETRAGRSWAATNDAKRGRQALSKISDLALRRRTEADLDLLQAQMFVHVDSRTSIQWSTAALDLFRAMREHYRIGDVLAVRAAAALDAGDLAGAEADLREAIREIDNERVATLPVQDRFKYAEARTMLRRQLVGLLVARGEVESALEEHEIGHGKVLRSVAKIAADLKLPEARSALPAHSAVVIYAVQPEEVFIWVVSRDAVSFHRSAVSEFALRELVNQFTSALRNGDRGDAAAVRLHSILLAPVEGRLQISDNVAIIPDGPLYRMSFAALKSPNSGRYFAEQKICVIAPNLGMLLSAMARSIQWRRDLGTALVVMRANGTLTPLWHGENETSRVARLYAQANTLRDNGDADVMSAMRDAAIIHVAGHTQIDPTQPFKSAFVSTKPVGTLGADDVLRVQFRRVPLVVLAGCNTGVSDVFGSEGSASMADAFLASGASAVVASLWDVEDSVASEFVLAFHSRVAAGAAPQYAFHETQLTMIRAGRPPECWAGFEFLGWSHITRAVSG